MVKIYVRADGNGDIGWGHIIRCLSLSRAFKEIGASVVFISCYNEAFELIRNHGIEVISVGTESVHGADIEANWICENINDSKKAILIIDSYNVSRNYFKILKKKFGMLVYVDDLNLDNYDVDIIVNGNVSAPMLNYENKNENTKLFLGLSYNLVRREFILGNGKKIDAQVKDVLITTGGGDPFNFTEKIIRYIREQQIFDGLILHVLVGQGFTNKKRLEKLSYTYSDIVLYKHLSDTSDLFKNLDIAISSAGSTLYELCAAGVPTLGFIYADNQEMISKGMAAGEYIVALGWYNQIEEKKFVENLSNLIKDVDKRKIMSRRQQALVDGKGAYRAAKAIIEMWKENKLDE